MARTKYSRDDMLRAARDILREKGASNLTIHEVAARIGATKGAVLHWYPTKNDLIDAVVGQLIDEWDTRFKENSGTETNIKSLLQAYFTTWRQQNEDQAGYGDAMILLLAEDPKKLGSVREAYAKYADPLIAHAQEDLDPIVLWLACEGLELLKLLGLVNFPGKLRNRLYDELMKRTSDMT